MEVVGIELRVGDTGGAGKGQGRGGEGRRDRPGALLSRGGWGGG